MDRKQKLLQLLTNAIESIALNYYYSIAFKKDSVTEIRVEITKEDFEQLEILYANELKFRKTKEFAEKKIDENLEKYHVDLLEKYGK